MFCLKDSSFGIFLEFSTVGRAAVPAGGRELGASEADLLTRG
jgi:hypothetical protein